MEMAIHPPIYAAVLGSSILALQSVLMLSVGMHRTRLRKGVGVDGDITLERLVRRHGNLAEAAAIFVAVLAVYELVLGQTGFAFWMAVIFGLARVMHAVGFSSDAGSHLVNAEGGRKAFLLLRASGAMITAFSSLTLAGALLLALIS